MFQRVADAPPAITGVPTNYDAMLVLWDEILKLPGGVSLEPSTAGNIIVLDNADAVGQLTEDVAAGTVPVVTCTKGQTCDYTACDEAGYCEMNLWAFGERIDDYVRGFQNDDGRARLKAARDARLCQVRPKHPSGEGSVFPMAPAMPSDFGGC
jgi:hypothetical protein